MVYLYAGLGVAMLAGIMAIFEMGLALTGSSLLPSPVDPYLSNGEVKEKDQTLIMVLANRDAVEANSFGTDLCEKVIAIYEDPAGLTRGVNPWRQALVMQNDDPKSYLKKGRWAGSCVMNDGAHRVVVKPDLSDGADPFQLYSCVLQPEDERCPFERDDVD